MKKLLLLIVFLLSGEVLRAQALAAKPAERTIRGVLAEQAAAWNRGDIEGYMRAGYWQSDSLLFMSATGPTRGYAATLARYRQRYPDATTMGQLSFEILRVEVASPDRAFVVGQWALKRANDNSKGAFTLLMARKKGQWMIVTDHSS
jgi:ketosteroid isomerase-like protein